MFLFLCGCFVPVGTFIYELVGECVEVLKASVFSSCSYLLVPTLGRHS